MEQNTKNQGNRILLSDDFDSIIGDVMPKPDNYLALAIFTTVCCCLPFGIYAIIKASSVNTFYQARNFPAALAASAEAKKWSIYGIVIGLVIDVLYVVVNVFGAMSAL